VLRGATPQLIEARSDQAVFNLAVLMDATTATWNGLKVENLDAGLVLHRNSADSKFLQFYGMMEVMIPFGDNGEISTRQMILTHTPAMALQRLRMYADLWTCLCWAPMRAYLDSYAATDAAEAAARSCVEIGVTFRTSFLE